jgi:hypothetical protein
MIVDATKGEVVDWGTMEIWEFELLSNLFDRHSPKTWVAVKMNGRFGS